MAITNTLVDSTTTTILFTASGEQAITTIFFCNHNSTTDAELDVYAVPSGGVVNSSTQILKNLSVPASETFVFDAEKLILSNGDQIYAQASVDKIITSTVSSVGI